jgi:DNA polymerase V
MYALVDCNNFYCSCERLFDPKLAGRPVIVLSNNDGCAISRSDEAKAIGIEMGTPAFLIEDKIRAHNVAVFSSNYTLYGDMSDRVMKTLASFCSAMEIFSIDEAFLDLHDMPFHDLGEHGQKMRTVVTQNTGIPITVGIGPTKVLAKMANRYAKKRAKHTGIFIAVNPLVIDEMLANTEVRDICGIGRQYALLLKTHGFKTAADFVKAPEEWVRVKMSVVGQRLLNELKGIPAVHLEAQQAPKKNIATSRSFGKLLQSKNEIAEALSNYTANCALKLRQQNSCCKTINVFVQTNPMRPDHPQYVRSINVELEVPSNDTAVIIKAAMKGLDIIYQPGYQFLKAGITVSEFVPAGSVQRSIFKDGETERSKKVMTTLDAINGSLGKEKVRLAIQGFQKTFRRRAAHLSPCYTTNIHDVLKVMNG